MSLEQTQHDLGMYNNIINYTLYFMKACLAMLKHLSSNSIDVAMLLIVYQLS